MGAPRRFLAPEAGGSPDLRLDPAESHHLLRVLRLAPGAAVEIFDGVGNAFSARFLSADDEGRCLVERGEALATREPPLSLVVGVAIPKGDSLTAIVRQLAEIGAGSIVPLTTEHSEGRATPARLGRWRAAALSGTRQSGRAAVPAVTLPVSFGIWIRGTLPEDRWIASPGPAAETFSTVPNPAPAGDRVLAIGAEGGFSEAELEDAYRHGFQRLDLGERILRTGTASVVAAAALLRS